MRIIIIKSLFNYYLMNYYNGMRKYWAHKKKINKKNPMCDHDLSIPMDVFININVVTPLYMCAILIKKFWTLLEM